MVAAGVSVVALEQSRDRPGCRRSAAPPKEESGKVAEVEIHFPGLRNAGKKPVLAFTIPEDELNLLAKSGVKMLFPQVPNERR